ncbi:MAG TPA: bacillithiol system redox-active protein YtxJ [Bacillota bacterium]|nr:bacillithiol system redox-active protein YtxJ [Bacillota bacterium]
MADIQELLEVEEVDKVLEKTEENPAFIFKQSTTCPISAEAFEQFKSYVETDARPYEAYFVKVRETRPVSNEIEEKLGIEHQSPQLFFVKDGQAVWNASHRDITVENIIAAVEDNE